MIQPKPPPRIATSQEERQAKAMTAALWYQSIEKVRISRVRGASNSRRREIYHQRICRGACPLTRSSDLTCYHQRGRSRQANRSAGSIRLCLPYPPLLELCHFLVWVFHRRPWRPQQHRPWKVRGDRRQPWFHRLHRSQGLRPLVFSGDGDRWRDPRNKNQQRLARG